MKTKRILFCGGLLLVAAASLALEKSGGKLVWHFLREPWKTHHDSNGIPKVIDVKKAPTSDFLTRLSASLPESKSILKTNPNLIADDYGANLHMTQEADIYVTFIHEGAGYRNSFGFFTFPDGYPPATKWDVDETIVFPNASYYNDGGTKSGSTKGLQSGDTIKIGHFSPNTNIGFVVVSNAFDASTGVSTQATGGPPAGEWIFYTLRQLNPETDPALKAHTVLLYDQPTDTVVLGLEDLKRDAGSDNDFNDVVFTVYSVPSGSIKVDEISPTADPNDQDKDGVVDDFDDYPTDKDRAFDISVSGTLAFEDSWPEHGDSDFNDLVVKYTFMRVQNAAGNVVDVRGRFEVAAHGSDIGDAFAVNLPGVGSSSVKQATVAKDGGAPATVSAENGQDGAVFVVFGDAGPHTPKGSCDAFNTEKGCTSGAAPVFELVVTFKTPVAPASVAAWDPFVFGADDRGRETHLPNHGGTKKADDKKYGTGDDDSDKTKGRYYLSFCNLPFAIDVPADWKWPAEGGTILDAYPDFGPWASSEGATNKDWYKTNVVMEKVWTP
jgi:LruC domain-containing protein